MTEVKRWYVINYRTGVVVSPGFVLKEDAEAFAKNLSSADRLNLFKVEER